MDELHGEQMQRIDEIEDMERFAKRVTVDDLW